MTNHRRLTQKQLWATTVCLNGLLLKGCGAKAAADPRYESTLKTQCSGLQLNETKPCTNVSAAWQQSVRVHCIAEQLAGHAQRKQKQQRAARVAGAPCASCNSRATATTTNSAVRVWISARTPVDSPRAMRQTWHPPGCAACDGYQQLSNRLMGMSRGCTAAGVQQPTFGGGGGERGVPEPGNLQEGIIMRAVAGLAGLALLITQERLCQWQAAYMQAKRVFAGQRNHTGN